MPVALGRRSEAVIESLRTFLLTLLDTLDEVGVSADPSRDDALADAVYVFLRGHPDLGCGPAPAAAGCCVRAGEASWTCYNGPVRPIEARYENGLLHPTKPLALRPGERVAVVVIRRPDPSRWDLDRLARHGDEDEALAGAGLDDWADALRREGDG
jgi:predicted DNA-binding antitoxin AbrB/MazE fold protein